MRKRHPLDVYREGRPFRREKDGVEGGAEADRGWTEAETADLDRSGWAVGPRLPGPRVLASLGGVLVLGLALVGPWLYTGRFWPSSVWNLSNSVDEDPIHQWPDRTEERPGGGEASRPEGSYIVLVATGTIAEKESEERIAQLERWDHEEQRLQQLVDARFPEQGISVNANFIDDEKHAVGLTITRWHDEDDPEMREVLDWVRALDDGQFSNAVVREVAES